MPQSPHWLQWDAPYSPPKWTLLVGQPPIPTTSLIPGPSRPIISNSIYIQLAVFPQCTRQTRHTDQQMVEATKPAPTLAYDCIVTRLTSPQSNLRTARRSSANKTYSKLLSSHSPSMLMPLAVRGDVGLGHPIWRRLSLRLGHYTGGRSHVLELRFCR